MLSITGKYIYYLSLHFCLDNKLVIYYIIQSLDKI